MISSPIKILLLALFAVCVSQASHTPAFEEEIVISHDSLSTRIQNFNTEVAAGRDPGNYKQIFDDIRLFYTESGKDTQDAINLFFALCHALIDSDFADPIRFEPVVDCFHAFFPDGWTYEETNAVKAIEIIKKATVAAKGTTFEGQLKGLKTRFSSASPAHSSPLKSGSRRNVRGAEESTPTLPRLGSKKSLPTAGSGLADTGKPPVSPKAMHAEGGAAPVSPKLENDPILKTDKEPDAEEATKSDPREKPPVPSPASTQKESSEPAKISPAKKVFVILAVLGIAALVGLELLSLAKAKKTAV